MKKFLSFMVMGLVGILPLTVNAEYGIQPVCDSADESGQVTCVIVYTADVADAQSSLAVTLTELGGAQILGESIVTVAGSDFSLNSNPTETNNVWSVNLISPDKVSGEADLFQFTYQSSGTEDCLVRVSLGNQTVNATPTTPSTPTTPDEPTNNVQTGSSLPYIALGAIALIAGGAYIVTRNKSKMYKI